MELFPWISGSMLLNNWDKYSGNLYTEFDKFIKFDKYTKFNKSKKLKRKEKITPLCIFSPTLLKIIEPVILGKFSR